MGRGGEGERGKVVHTYGAVLSSATLTRTSEPIQAISFTSLFLDYFEHLISLYYIVLLILHTRRRNHPK